MNGTETRECSRCLTFPSVGPCCSAHEVELCHGCYRLLHFVEVCIEGCEQCAAENLPRKLSEADK